MEKELVLKVYYKYAQSFSHEKPFEKLSKYPLKKGNVIDLKDITLEIKEVKKDSITFDAKNNTNIGIRIQKNNESTINLTDNNLNLNIKDKLVFNKCVLDASVSWTLSLEYI